MTDTTPTKLTPEAKAHLSTTIRSLRERLLRDIRSAAEQDYRLTVRAQDAGLAEAARMRRRRLEEWLDERVRSTQPENDTAKAAARERYLGQAVEETAATLLNRLVLLRHMEALELVKPPVVTGGWNSKGYRELRDFAPGLLGDLSEGYAYLLGLVFDELALDLPGLFGDVGLMRLFRIPASTLREVVEQFDDSRLKSAWTDDTTLGWVYQYWNDPQREALDAKINAGGKVERHEIASKTQMFTERYMVEWLLHNSLGLTWLCLCKKHGWTPDAELVLDDLDERRAAWRAKREKGEVALDALMPVSDGLEDHWKYYVPQPIPDDAVASAPTSIRELKLLDPACGSGHFLVIAFDLLVALYREEARHRGEQWSDREIAESILENNLHGVDIDPRSIQIAAAGLYLKVRLLAPEARIRQINLVAPALNLAHLPHDDPALVRLLREARAETGIPEELSRRLVTSLAGVDYLGTLLKVDAAVDAAIAQFEGAQLELDFSTTPSASRRAASPPAPAPLTTNEAGGGAVATKAVLLAKLEQFLARHEGQEDLGLRLDGEQLAAGVRFVRLVRENTYDIVVGNPPYQGTSKMVDSKYVAKHYPRGKADLYAAFLERGLELARRGGMSALLTMRGWMFINQYRKLREYLLQSFDLRTIGDFDKGAFEIMTTSQLISVSLIVFRKDSPSGIESVALQPTAMGEKYWDRNRTPRKRAAVLAQVGRYTFDPRGFAKIEGEPMVYWWGEELLEEYNDATKLGEKSPARFGTSTANNTRFVRFVWECQNRRDWNTVDPISKWSPWINGAKGRAWIEPHLEVVKWQNKALEMAHLKGSALRNLGYVFKRGIAFSMIGSSFCARSHRYPSVVGDKGSSVFPEHIAATLMTMNSRACRRVVQDLNPTVSFQVGDVNRLPIFPVESADEIYANLEAAFTQHEAARENSVEFKKPGSSPWLYAQEWAQQSVDRPSGAPLAPYVPECDSAEPEQFVSFAVGVALGRFGATGEGILDKASDSTLPDGILFLSNATERDGLDHSACDLLETMWAEHGVAVNSKDDLRAYLRKGYFDYHCKLYENRPIYFPLSSSKRNFVAYVSIHRWQHDTLQTLLAEHLLPERRRLDGELEDLRKARADGSATNQTEKRFDSVKKIMTELEDFIAAVTTIADAGPPPTDSKCPIREVDATFEIDLDDGVMVNSAALWPLLEPQWKKPKGWWKELAEAKGKKDYDWSHLAARYFPERVDTKCCKDPSLGVAHGCFWKYHPAKAYQWELRLQDEIEPGFTIDEAGSDELRARYLADHAGEAAEIKAKEMKRRAKAQKQKAKKEPSAGPLFDRPMAAENQTDWEGS